MTSHVEAAMEDLRRPGKPVADAMQTTPDARGLYAIRVNRAGLDQIGLIGHDPAQPVYTGLASKSLKKRDTRQHFASKATGSSTVRRTLAALLADVMGFVPVPRGTRSPRSKWKLETEAQEVALTEWMQKHLNLAVWAAPAGTDLSATETSITQAWRPPLNQINNPDKWPHLPECLEEMRSRVDRSRRQNVSPT